MKIWITKYCLTEGIVEDDVQEPTGTTRCIQASIGGYYVHGEGINWHRTKEAAIARAEEVRIKKLKSLDKSIKKISALKFD